MTWFRTNVSPSAMLFIFMLLSLGLGTLQGIYATTETKVVASIIAWMTLMCFTKMLPRMQWVEDDKWCSCGAGSASGSSSRAWRCCSPR